MKNDSKGKVTPSTPISDEAMEALARLMNDSPTVKKLHGTEWEIHALKPGAQWLIAEEAQKIVKKEKMSMGDVIKEMAANIPSVARILTIALLNDKAKINGEEYDKVYDTLLWGEYTQRDWAELLFEVMKLIDVDFFLANTNAVQTLRETTLGRKMTVLRANPWCSREEYLWGMTVAQVRLASLDFSHVEYTDKGDSNQRTINIETADDMKNLTDLGIPII